MRVARDAPDPDPQSNPDRTVPMTSTTTTTTQKKGTTMFHAKKIAAVTAATIGALTLTGCMDDDADVVSENLSKAADNFEVTRRVVMFNGITDEYLMEIKGACSINDSGNQLEVVCKIGKGKYKKHFLGLSDNVSYFVEQGEPVKASANHYRVTFKPQAILPDVDFRGSTEDLPRTQ